MDVDRIKQQLIKDVRSLRAPEGFVRAGKPRYYTLFGRDSIIIAWQLLDFDPTIARDTLRVLAHFQGQRVDFQKEEEPGKIIHEWWGDIVTKKPKRHLSIPWPLPYYGSIDATFLYLWLAALYLENTDDDSTIIALKPDILAAIQWTQTYADIDRDEFVEYQRKNPRGLYYQGWRDGMRHGVHFWKAPIEPVEVQGYKYAVYTALGRIMSLYRESDLNRTLQESAKRLQEIFLKKYWWPKERYFYFLFDGKDQPASVVTSNPGHLLFTGILPAKYTEQICARLFADDLWTPFGIRTESTESSDFNPNGYQQGSVWPHDNWIITEGLWRTGYHVKYRRIREALLAAYDKLGRLPEFYSVSKQNQLEIPDDSNRLQGWASAGLLNLLLRKR